MERVDYFDEISDESRAYWLGFLYAECCLLQNRKQVFVLLGRRDRAHLEKLASIFDRPVYEHSSFDRRNGKTYLGARLILNGKHLWYSLNQKGFAPRKSLIEDASVLDHVPEELKRHFVRGLIDGDGSIGHYGVGSRGSFRATLTGTEAMLARVRRLMAERLGLRSNQLNRNGSVRSLAWSGAWALSRIRMWFYGDATIWLERKKAIFDEVPCQRGSSKFVGVYLSSRNELRWIARIYHEGKTRHIGSYSSEEEAARAYDLTARNLYGIDANVNFPEYEATPALIGDFAR